MSAKTKRSIGETIKSESVSLNNNNYSRRSNGYYQDISSSYSSDEDIEHDQIHRPSNSKNDLPKSYMNALVIGAGDHYENAYSPFNEEYEVEFDDENIHNGE